MRIGLVSYEYPPQRGLGGVGTYTYRLAGALGRRGYEVVVLSGPGRGVQVEQPNVMVHRLAARYEPQLPLAGLRWMYWKVLAEFLQRSNPIVWHWLRWDMASAAALREIHAETPLDVVEAPEHAANGLPAGMDGRWPMVLRTHGPWDLFYSINRHEGLALNHLLAELERRSVQYAQVITSPSRTMSEYMQKRWELPRAPRVLPNFMDVPEEPPPLPDYRAAPRIVCAGRIERFKGQDVLVRAFVELAGRHRTARLVLVGPDQWSRRQSFERVIEELAPDPAIRARIDTVGLYDLDRTQEALSGAALAVVPSVGFESFSFSTLEAMAAGRPTICTNIGAMPELLDYGRCGVIVPPNDVRALAGAMERLLGDRALARRLATAGHARAREVYDTGQVLDGFLEAYEDARDAFSPGRGHTSITPPMEKRGGTGRPRASAALVRS